MNCLSEESEQLDKNDLIKIKQNLTLQLKKHQETIICAMLKLENNGYSNVKYESRVIKNIIECKDDYAWRNDEYKLLKFQIETNFGILADKVGAGKTFEILGLICNTIVPPCHPKIISSSYCSVIKYFDINECIKSNLIIVPHNLILQWKKAAEYTKLKCFTISKHSHIEQDLKFINITEQTKHVKEMCIDNYDIILISASMLEDFNIHFKNIKWSRIVIDEVASIKLPNLNDLNANFTWFITATPAELRYVRRTYIKDMTTGMSRCAFNGIIVKNIDVYVDQSMQLPKFNQIIIRCFTPAALKILNNFISQDVFNMLNAGDINGAIKSLNCNVDTDDNIIQILTKNVTKDIHNKKAELLYNEQIIPLNRKPHDDHIKRIKDSISSLETRLDAITHKIKELNEDSCPVCLDDFNVPTVISCCNNIFCFTCLSQSKGKCPMCRTPFTPDKLSIIDNEKKLITKQLNIQKKLLTKQLNLINIIKKKKDGKFLVFSSYENTNDNISKYFDDANINYAKLAGNVAMINKTIENFTNGTTRVLLLNASYYGSGLNLQIATDIIIYHQMDIQLETQVIGRAQRYGRNTTLNVYYLFNDKERPTNSDCMEFSIYENDDDNKINEIFNIEQNEVNKEVIIVEKKQRKKKVVI